MMHYAKFLLASLLLITASSGCMIVRLFSDETEAQGIHPVHAPPIHHPAARPEGVSSESENPDSPELTANTFSVFKVHQGVINSLAVSQDGLNAYTGGEDGKVIFTSRVAFVYGEDAKSTKKRSFAAQSEVLLAGDRPVFAMALSHDERYLAISQFSLLTLYDLQTRAVVKQLTQVKGRITAVTWDPRGQLVVMGLANGDIFGWSFPKGPATASDSLDYVEEYHGGASPIVGLFFHPSGRAFFSAEREGSVDLWRLLRTEKEMGLRDDFALEDKELEGKTHKDFGNLNQRIQDAWVSSEGDYIFVATADGQISRWKVRGRIADGQIRTGKEAVLSFVGVTVAQNKVGKAGGARAKGNFKLLTSAGRDQRLKLWCQTPDQTSTLDPKNPGRELATAPVAQSVVLKEPLTLIRAGSQSPILWGTEKTGNLLTFDLREIIGNSALLTRLQRCL